MPQTQRKILLKKGKKITRGGTRPKPSKENKKQKETKQKNKQKTKIGNICLQEPRAREPTLVQEEISLKSLRQH